MVSESEIREFLDFNFSISKSFKGKECGIELKLATDFHHKIILTGYTLYYIFYPRPNDIFQSLTKGAITYDYPSAYTLIRVMFEAFVNCNYILFSSGSKTELNYRILRWNIHELQERIKLLEIIKSTNKQKDVMVNELTDQKIALQKNEYFIQMSERMKEDILHSNKWSTKSIFEKCKSTEIHPTIISYLYKHTSNFVHSEPISIAQLHAVKSQEEINILLDIPKKFVIMFCSLSLDILMKLSEEIRIEVTRNVKILNTITIHKALSKLKMDDIS